eukprot:scaffold258291_cov32-Tisochrysis_lutea.AAC.2
MPAIKPRPESRCTRPTCRPSCTQRLVSKRALLRRDHREESCLHSSAPPYLRGCPTQRALPQPERESNGPPHILRCHRRRPHRALVLRRWRWLRLLQPRPQPRQSYQLPGWQKFPSALRVGAVFPRGQSWLIRLARAQARPLRYHQKPRGDGRIQQHEKRGRAKRQQDQADRGFACRQCQQHARKRATSGLTPRGSTTCVGSSGRSRPHSLARATAAASESKSVLVCVRTTLHGSAWSGRSAVAAAPEFTAFCLDEGRRLPFFAVRPASSAADATTCERRALAIGSGLRRACGRRVWIQRPDPAAAAARTSA